MKKFYFLLIIIASVVYYGCKIEEEEDQNPTCHISSPSNGQNITKGELVTISVDATDKDNSISKVIFLLMAGKLLLLVLFRMLIIGIQVAKALVLTP